MKRNIAGIVAVVAVVLAVIVIVKYNGLVAKEEAVDKSWATLVMKLKERYSPIPRLISDVTAYVGRKSDIAKELESDLAQVTNIKTISEAVDYANQVETDLTQLIQWLRERYPGVINRHSIQVIAETLRNTENSLGPEEKMFNEAAEKYNSYARRFPNNIVAMLLMFPSKYEYYQPKRG